MPEPTFGCAVRTRTWRPSAHARRTLPSQTPQRAARTLPSRPGKRASRSARRSVIRRSRPWTSWVITPASRRTRKWWLAVDLETGRPKVPQARASCSAASVRTTWRRTGSLSACRTASSVSSPVAGCGSGGAAAGAMRTSVALVSTDVERIRRRSSALALEEREHAAPRVLAGLGVLLEAAVEERVRRAGVDDDLVLHAGGGERVLEGVELLGRDALVRAAVEAEDRPPHVHRAVDRRRVAPALGIEAAVEADRAREAQLSVRGSQERLRAAEAEADGDRAVGARALAQRGERGGEVRLHRGRARLPHMRPEVEVLAARPQPRRPAEVVDDDRVVADLREALGELGVERVEPADVGQDGDRRAARAGRLRQRGREARAVRRGQLQRLRAGPAGDRRARQVGGEGGRARVEGEAHDRPRQYRRGAWTPTAWTASASSCTRGASWASPSPPSVSGPSARAPSWCRSTPRGRSSRSRLGARSPAATSSSRWAATAPRSRPCASPRPRACRCSGSRAAASGR